MLTLSIILLHKVHKPATIYFDSCPAFGPNREHWEVMATKHGPIGTPLDSPLGFAHTKTIDRDTNEELITQGTTSNIRAKWERTSNENRCFGESSNWSHSSPSSGSNSEQESSSRIKSAIKNVLAPMLDVSEEEKCDTDSTSEDSQFDESNEIEKEKVIHHDVQDVVDSSCKKIREVDDVLGEESGYDNNGIEEEKEDQIDQSETFSEHSVTLSYFESSDVIASKEGCENLNADYDCRNVKEGREIIEKSVAVEQSFPCGQGNEIEMHRVQLRNSSLSENLLIAGHSVHNHESHYNSGSSIDDGKLSHDFSRQMQALKRLNDIISQCPFLNS